jgi:hypothetical protein
MCCLLTFHRAFPRRLVAHRHPRDFLAHARGDNQKGPFNYARAMTLTEYIESLQQFLVAHPEAGNLPVVDSYDESPNPPEITEGVVVAADTY